MGIPYLFAHLRRRFSPSVRDVDPSVSPYGPVARQYDCLYLDFNSIVHEAANSVCSTPDGGTATDEAVISESLRRLAKIATCPLLRPKRLLYVAVDGPPPLAKMHQQRSRRFGAHQARGHHPDTHGNDTAWDRNQVSPGTPFMRRLDTALQAYCADLQRAESPPQTVIANPHSELGEGEQKIFMHIAASEHKDERIVVYGVDADIILMSLLSPAWERIDLYRPGIRAEEPAAAHHTQNGGGARGDGGHERRGGGAQSAACILNTRTLRTRLATEIDVHDFVVLCLLLGNDFIPSLTGFQLRNDGLQTLVSIFKRCVLSAQDGVVGGGGCGSARLAEGGPDSLGGINVAALLALMSGVAEVESQLAREEDASYKERCTRHRGRAMRCPNSAPQQTGQLNPLEHPEPHIVNFVHHGGGTDSNWRTRYYHALFDGGAAGSPALVRNITLSYITGLGWAYAYLGRQKTVAPGWVYPHAYAPLALDMVHLLSEPAQRLLTDIDAHLSARDQTFNHFMKAMRQAGANIAWARCEHPEPIFLELLLFAILPPASLRRAVAAIDVHTVTATHSPTGFMFPERCAIRTYLRDKGWECKALLPPIDLDMLAETITTASKNTEV